MVILRFFAFLLIKKVPLYWARPLYIKSQSRKVGGVGRDRKVSELKGRLDATVDVLVVINVSLWVLDTGVEG